MLERMFRLLTSCFLLVAGGGNLLAEAPRVLLPGQLPQDRRLGALKDLNGYFPFTPSETKEIWEERGRDLRRRILVSTGLWPMPPRTPLKAKVYGRAERDGFTVEVDTNNGTSIVRVARNRLSHRLKDKKTDDRVFEGRETLERLLVKGLEML